MFVLVGGGAAEEQQARLRPLQPILLEAAGIQPVQVEEGLTFLMGGGKTELFKSDRKSVCTCVIRPLKSGRYTCTSKLNIIPALLEVKGHVVEPLSPVRW